MGIIGENIALGLSNQIKIRQEKLGNPTLSTDDIIYNNSKTSWLRVASSVNVRNAKSAGVGDMRIPEGNSLAKNLVLMGPAIDSEGNIQSKIYPTGPDIGEFAQSLLGVGGDTSKWGLTPPPGVESVSIQALNRGAIRKAQIKIKAHSPDQFRLIEVLYLRLGYTILVEWGHSTYYDNDGTLQQFDGFATSPFTKFIEGTGDFDEINKELLTERNKRDYNYDGFLGYISNFNWGFNPDGSYDISLDVISRGGLIDSLSTNKAGTNNTIPATQGSGTILGDYLKNFYTVFKSAARNQNDACDVYQSKTRNGQKNPKIVHNTADNDAEVLLLFSMEQIGEIERYAMLKNDASIATSQGQEVDFYYISMGMLLRLLSTRCLVYQEDKTTPVVKINSEYNTHWMLSHPYQQSIDPRICRLKNSLPVTVNTQKDDLSDWAAALGWVWPIFEDNGGTTTPPGVQSDLFKPGYVRGEAPSNPYAGDIMGIMLNLSFIINAINKNIDEESNLGIKDLLTYILNEVAKATGGINKFNVSYSEEKNEIIIYDDNTIPQKTGGANDKTPIHIYGLSTKDNPTPQGLGSFVTNLNFSSKIFPKLQNQVAIAAQNPEVKIDPETGDETPIPVGEKITSFQRLNRGIVDRTSRGAKGYYEGTDNATPLTTMEKFNDEIWDLNEFFERIYIDRSFTDTDEEIESKRAALKSILEYDFSWRSGKKEIASPYFIPVELSLELEGISGFKLYEKFDISPDYILPLAYPNNLNFIIQGVSHDLNGGKWTTKLQTLSWTAEESNDTHFSGEILYGASKAPTTPNRGRGGSSSSSSNSDTSDIFTDPTLEPKLKTISNSIATNFGVRKGTYLTTDEAVQFLHPKVRSTMKGFLENVMKDPRLKGSTIGITSSLRTFEQQQRLHNQKPGKNAKAGRSKHNYGCAFDMVILDQKTGRVIAGKTVVGTDAEIKAMWIRLGVPEIAIQSGIPTWGGDFRSYFDPVHFGVDVNVSASLEKAKEYAINHDMDYKKFKLEIFDVDISTA